MGCITSKYQIFDNDYFTYNNHFNKQSLTYNASKHKEEKYLIQVDIDGFTKNNIKYIKNEFLKYELSVTDLEQLPMRGEVSILNKIMKVIHYYIRQKEIKIIYIDYLYFHNDLHGNILQITNKNAFMSRFNDNVKTNKSYFLKCNLDEVYS